MILIIVMMCLVILMGCLAALSPMVAWYRCISFAAMLIRTFASDEKFDLNALEQMQQLYRQDPQRFAQQYYLEIKQTRASGVAFSIMACIILWLLYFQVT